MPGGAYAGNRAAGGSWLGPGPRRRTDRAGRLGPPPGVTRTSGSAPRLHDRSSRSHRPTRKRCRGRYGSADLDGCRVSCGGPGLPNSAPRGVDSVRLSRRRGLFRHQLHHPRPAPGPRSVPGSRGACAPIGTARCCGYQDLPGWSWGRRQKTLMNNSCLGRGGQAEKGLTSPLLENHRCHRSLKGPESTARIASASSV
jgi:hypothetical protein